MRLTAIKVVQTLGSVALFVGLIDMIDGFIGRYPHSALTTVAAGALLCLGILVLVKALRSVWRKRR